MKKICVIAIVCLFLITTTLGTKLLVISGGADDLSQNITINIAFYGPSWDINHDGVEDTYDISLLVSNYGLSGLPGWIRSDVNGDGTIDTYDVSIEVTHYGQAWIS